MKDIKDVRAKIHDVLNVLAIAKGMTEGIEASLKGELDMTEEQMLDKLTKALKSMDRIEEYVLEIRTYLIDKNEK